MQKDIQKIIGASDNIVIIQADNPDADSLASALALEQILSELGKQVELYCGAVVPGYLRYLPGWDRVQDQLPIGFDTSIIVDTSAITLLEQLEKSQSLGWLRSKPCIVLDHHEQTEATIDFADLLYIQPAVSTGELIYGLCLDLDWPVSADTAQLLLASILSDSLGLTSEGTTARSIRIVAELVEQGADIPALENDRRKLQKKSREILSYKARLLGRVEYSDDGHVATVTIPWEEIEKYSNQYNPSVLVLDEMRMVEDVIIAVAFKQYPDGKVTAKLRSNYGYGIAGEIARSFGGGGHAYAAGFKITSGKPFNEIKSECISRAQEIIATLKKDTDNENTQHAYTVD